MSLETSLPSANSSSSHRTALTSGWVSTRVTRLLSLQQDSVYIEALNKVSDLVLSNLENHDFLDSPLPEVLCWESIIQYFYWILYKWIESLNISEEEFTKMKQYLEIKNNSEFDDSIIIERMIQSITIWVMDIFSCTLAWVNYSIDIKKLQRLVYLNLQAGTADAEKVFTTVIEKVVQEYHGHPDEEVIVQKLEAVNTANFENFSRSSLSACPFFKSPEKKQWVEWVFRVLQERYIPEFQKLQNAKWDVLHDFYSVKYQS